MPIKEDQKFSVHNNLLHYAHSNITKQDIKEIVKIIQVNKAITHLNLRSCNLDDVQIEELVSSDIMWQVNYIDLYNNKITNLGANTIANVLKNSVIYSILLGNNPIGTEGISALLKSLKFSKVVCLDISQTDNEFKPELKPEIITTIKECGNLQILDLRGVLSHKERSDDILPLLTKNRVYNQEVIDKIFDKNNPILHFEKELLVEFQRIFNNVFLRPKTNDHQIKIKNTLDNFIKYNFFKLTKVVNEVLDTADAGDNITIKDMPTEILGEIFQYCNISDVV